MKKKSILLIIFLIAILFVTSIPNNVFAESQQLNLKIGSWWNEKDMYTMGIDVNLYYSFFNKESVNLTIDGNKASLILEEDDFYHDEKHFHTPRMVFEGTYEKSGNMNTISLSGNADGTFVNEFTTRVNYYYYTLTRLDLELEYYDSKIENGTVEVSGSARTYGSSVHKNADGPEEIEDIDNMAIITLKEFEISGLSDKNEIVAPASNSKNDEVSTENITDEKSNSKVPSVIIGTTVIVLGGIAFKRFIKAKGADGEIKTYEFNHKTGDYENGDTILNTSNIEEAENQRIKDEEWINNEREKIKNKDTLQDKENEKMIEEEKQKIKEVERENYIDRVASHNGINSTNEDVIKEELAKKQTQKEEYAKERNEILEHIDTVTKTAEVIEEGADYAISAGEVLVPGGKTVSAGYKFVKNVAKTAVDSTKNGGDVVESIITSAADAANTFVDNKIIKAGTTIGSNIAGKTANAVYNGDNIIESVEEGAKTGTASAIVNALGDEIGTGIGGDAGQIVGNISSGAYQKHVVDKKMEEKTKKKD